MPLIPIIYYVIPIYLLCQVAWIDNVSSSFSALFYVFLFQLIWLPSLLVLLNFRSQECS